MDTFNFNRLNMNSADSVQLNMDALYRIAPSVFTEAADPKTGKVSRKVDFEELRRLLGDNVMEEGGESYQFTWVGKNAAKAEAARPTDKTLRPVPEDSVDWDNTKNLYIEGDNLEVLKLLQRSYLGKVKMIYIDPPYNTGNDFVYDDDFSRTAAEEDLEAGNVDELGLRYRKNTDSNGKFHSDWCSMIYPRLLVARSLLSEDGVIFISIDDNEVANLKKICDEVFGEGNFVDVFNWAKTETPENLSKKSKQIIEYVLCYEKNHDSVKLRGIKKESASSNGLLNQPNKIKTLVFPAGVVSTSIKDGTITPGMYGTGKYDIELLQETEVRNGMFVKDVVLRAKFKWSQENLNEEIKKGTLIRIPKMTFSPSYEKKEYDAEVPSNLINSKVGVSTNEVAGEYQLKLFHKKVFNYPKPISLIKYLAGFKDDGEDMIVLDFFSGSATTAEAVFEMNANERNGSVRFILVQLQEDLYDSLASAKSDSAKEICQNAIDFCAEHKFPTNLCEVAKERIRRAGKKIKEESPLTTQDLDIGFRVFRLDESNYEEVSKSPSEYSQDSLSLFENNIKADRTDMDLLFGSMLAWGVTLDLPMETETIDGCTVYTVNGGDLVACFSSGITDKVVTVMAAKMPLRVLFRDACFTQDAQKINIYEQFKQAMDWADDEAMKNIRVI